MSLTDPIADMLTKIRNASNAMHEVVDVPASNIKKEITRVLKNEGYIKDFKYLKSDSKGVIRIFLKYTKSRDKIISGIKRISKPGLRVYVSKDNIPKVLGGLGVAVMSTPKGVMSDKNSREMNVGGEVLCYIW
ncbi:MAG: 30S ribosomal protein S8 [Candidatus Wallbacteria bacterium]